MVYPIMPQQRNNYQPGINPYSNQRLPTQINRPTHTNGIQRIFKSLSKPNSSIGTLATKGFGDISKTLSNVDQVIKVVRSASPIVQEYGPMVKNLPAMYRMVKALGQIEDNPNDKQVREIEPSKDRSTNKENAVEQEESYFAGESTPRLYI